MKCKCQLLDLVAEIKDYVSFVGQECVEGVTVQVLVSD